MTATSVSLVRSVRMIMPNDLDISYGFTMFGNLPITGTSLSAEVVAEHSRILARKTKQDINK